LSLPRTGQAYELGHVYEPGMPLYGERPWYIATVPGATPTSEEGGATHTTEYFTGYIGQMGTQWDALGHQGENQGSPGIGGEVARWLVARRVAVVGADSCCVEVRPRLGTDNVHHILFRSEGISMIENMVFDELARDEVYEFLFLALTERIKGATGSPVRPIAVR
jgi:kynurenine formamidase